MPTVEELKLLAGLKVKLGFCVTRGSVQYIGSSGVRPATEAEKKMWAALVEAEKLMSMYRHAIEDIAKDKSVGK